MTGCVTAKHVEFHQLLVDQAAPDREKLEKPRLQDCSEACIACRRAFLTLPAWANHAARVHGFRAPGTRLAQGRTCKGCGRTYATQQRLKRHLDNSDACLLRWGFPARRGEACCLRTLASSAIGRLGFFREGCDSGIDPSVCQEFLDELNALREGSAPDLITIAGKHPAPLAVLRNTLSKWMDSLDVGGSLYACGESASLPLFPEHLCDEIQPFPKKRPVFHEGPPDFKALSPISCAASGECRRLEIKPPPVTFPLCPWQHFGSLREARARLAWLSDALETCTVAIAAAASQPVALAATAREALPMLWGWFRELEFVPRSPGFTF